MHLDADDILERIRRDYPDAYELSLLRCQVDALGRENEALAQENRDLRAKLDRYGPPADSAADTFDETGSAGHANAAYDLPADPATTAELPFDGGHRG
jgi:regulator of replication initiation timing